MKHLTIKNLICEHHVPPRSVGGKMTIKVPANLHHAYHLIFGNAESYEKACQILWEEWWQPACLEKRKAQKRSKES